MNVPVTVIGVPTDFGANRRGVDMGPSAIRYAGLGPALSDAGIDWEDRGDIPTSPELHESTGPDFDAVETLSHRLETAVTDVRHADRLPLVLGGDHSIAFGSVAGATTQFESIGLLWFDAHGDFNTPERSPSGNVHGMVLAGLLGDGSFPDTGWPRVPELAPTDVTLIGTRDLDPEERTAIVQSPVTVKTMTDVDATGVGSTVKTAIEQLLERVDAIYVTFDLDVIDPIEAPGVGTPVRGGLTYREAHLTMELVADHLTDANRLAGIEFVEVNPIRDRENRTAELATELAASALGDRIL